MRLTNTTLPHPVLGQFDAISGIVELRNPETSGNPEIEKSENTFEVKLKLYHENEAIHDLVAAGKAQYFCEISCSDTLYRSAITSSEQEIKVLINRMDVRRKVHIEAFCVTTQEISNYLNPKVHEDYLRFNFTLDEGDLLIYFGRIVFDANIQYEKLKAASSFMEIIPHDGKEDYVDFVLDNPKILIKLPVEDYNLYKMDMIRLKKEYSPIIHASLVQTALTTALFNLDKYAEKGALWATSLKYRLEHEPEINGGFSEIDTNDISKVIHRLLGNPTNRLLMELKKLAIESNQIESL